MYVYVLVRNKLPRIKQNFTTKAMNSDNALPIYFILIAKLIYLSPHSLCFKDHYRSKIHSTRENCNSNLKQSAILTKGVQKQQQTGANPS